MTLNSHGAEDPGQAWITWLNEHESLEISEWLLRWADAQPDRSETFPSWKRKLIDRCDAKYRLAATEINQLRVTLERVTKERDEARLEVCNLEAKQAITVHRENGLKRRDIGSLEFYMELFACIKEWDLSKHFKKQNLPKHFYREDGSHIDLSISMREVV